VENYQLLFKEKENFYKINNQDESIINIEKIHLKSIIESDLNLTKIYYNLDNHNLFKRIDRYHYRKTLLGIFTILSGLNIFEIGFNIYFFFDKKNSDYYSKEQRIATIFPNIFYIITIQCLATLVIVKRKIETLIYY